MTTMKELEKRIAGVEERAANMSELEDRIEKLEAYIDRLEHRNPTVRLGEESRPYDGRSFATAMYSNEMDRRETQEKKGKEAQKSTNR